MTDRGDRLLEDGAEDLFSPLESLMTRPVAVVDAGAPLRMALEMMAEDGLGALIVVGPDGPRRIVSERDVLVALADDGDLDELVVDDVATPELVGADRDSTVVDAARLMVGYGIRHVPVVTDDEHIVGMVSARDVLRVMVDQITSPTGHHQ